MNSNLQPISSIKDLQFLITGTSRGIGLSLVKKILELNGNVIATCRNPATAIELNHLQSIYPEPKLIILQLDVTNKEALEDIRGTIRKKGIDTIDVCIANAGVASKNHPYDPAWTCPEDDLMKTFQTNTMGTLFTAQSIAPLLSMSKKAKLFIAIGSRLGSLTEATGVGGYTSYRISKAGLNMACVCMAHDPSMMGIGIKFLVLHPGWVNTDMGSAGGRQCPQTLEESCTGMVNVMLRAIDVQMYVMGSSVYEERTWSKKSSTSETARPPPLPEPSSEPSRALKCPYSGANLQLSTQPAPPAEPTSEKAKCPYHGGDVSPAPKDVTEPTNEPASASKCPFSFGNDDDLTNGIDFGSDDDGEPASCPFGTIQPEVPAMTEDHFHLISSRFQTLAGLQSADNIFENQFLKQRCVFVSFDGTILPW